MGKTCRKTLGLEVVSLWPVVFLGLYAVIALSMTQFLQETITVYHPLNVLSPFFFFLHSQLQYHLYAKTKWSCPVRIDQSEP